MATSTTHTKNFTIFQQGLGTGIETEIQFVKDNLLEISIAKYQTTFTRNLSDFARSK